MMPILCILFLNISLQAQTQSVLDGAYIKETNLTKRVVPYPALREADVMYVRRIWQDIDLRQKINQMFYYPVEPIEDRKNLWDVIRFNLDGEQLTAYGLGPAGNDDEFRYQLDGDQVDSLLNPKVLISEYDLITGEVIGSKEVKSAITSNDIKRYRIKEDWVWDKQRSQRHVRIIGIAPIIEKKDDQGEGTGAFAPLFWLYYPECRYVFANAECYNYENDAQRRTFEEIFQKRYFSSYIVKETNVFDRSIADYAQGLDALLESERIKDELFTIEHDLWHY